MGILKPKIKLTCYAIFAHPVNKSNKITTQSQLYWIAEAIIYILPEVKKLDLPSNLWPSIPIINRLPTQKLHHFALGLILKNKGTVKGIYSILRNIFSGNNSKGGFQEGQLRYKDSLFTNKLVLINGN